MSEDHDTLIRIDGNVKNILGQMKKLNGRLATAEEKIDSLESYKDKIVGSVALVSALFGGGIVWAALKLL